jgi:hypothetical protein
MYQYGTQLNIATHDFAYSHGLRKGDVIYVEKDYGNGTIRIYCPRLSLHMDFDEDNLDDLR